MDMRAEIFIIIFSDFKLHMRIAFIRRNSPLFRYRYLEKKPCYSLLLSLHLKFRVKFGWFLFAQDFDVIRVRVT